MNDMYMVELVVQYVLFQGNVHSGTALDLEDTTAWILVHLYPFVEEILKLSLKVLLEHSLYPIQSLAKGILVVLSLQTTAKLTSSKAHFHKMEQSLVEPYLQNKAP